MANARSSWVARADLRLVEQERGACRALTNPCLRRALQRVHTTTSTATTTTTAPLVVDVPQHTQHSSSHRRSTAETIGSDRCMLRRPERSLLALQALLSLVQSSSSPVPARLLVHARPLIGCPLAARLHALSYCGRQPSPPGRKNTRDATRRPSSRSHQPSGLCRSKSISPSAPPPSSPPRHAVMLIVLAVSSSCWRPSLPLARPVLPQTF